MRSHIESLIAQFEDVFYGKPWYGDGVVEKLEKMDPEHVAIAPFGKLHSVIQLVQHMTAWKTYLIEKMNGNDSYKIVADSEVEWPSQSSPETWEIVLKELKDTHAMLIRDLKQKNDDWLLILNPGTDFTYGTLVQGVIHHDVYHVGQIGVISRMIETDLQKSR